MKRWISSIPPTSTKLHFDGRLARPFSFAVVLRNDVVVFHRAPVQRYAPSAAASSRPAAALERLNTMRGAHMARKQHVAVEPRPDGRWAVQTNGTQRADSLHDRQADAINRARELAKNKKTELVVKDQRGRIRVKDSHGPDSRKVKG
jgi:hypothetical protein